MTFLVVSKRGAVLSTHDNISAALDLLKSLPKAHRVYRSDGVPMTTPWSKANAHVPEGVTIDPIDIQEVA